MAAPTSAPTAPPPEYFARIVGTGRGKRAIPESTESRLLRSRLFLAYWEAQPGPDLEWDPWWHRPGITQTAGPCRWYRRLIASIEERLANEGTLDAVNAAIERGDVGLD